MEIFVDFHKGLDAVYCHAETYLVEINGPIDLSKGKLYGKAWTFLGNTLYSFDARLIYQDNTRALIGTSGTALRVPAELQCAQQITLANKLDQLPAAEVQKAYASIIGKPGFFTNRTDMIRALLNKQQSVLQYLAEK